MQICNNGLHVFVCFKTFCFAFSHGFYARNVESVWSGLTQREVNSRCVSANACMRFLQSCSATRTVLEFQLVCNTMGSICFTPVLQCIWVHTTTSQQQIPHNVANVDEVLDITSNVSKRGRARVGGLEIIKKMLNNVWPKDQPAVRARVITAVGLLVGAKVSV